MILENEENNILKCHQLFHYYHIVFTISMYIIDIHAKITTEHLIFIHLNQTIFCSEESVHLRDVVVNDITNVEN